MDSNNNNEGKNQYPHNSQPVDYSMQYSPYSCPMFYDEPIDDDEYYDMDEDDDINAGFRKRNPRKRRRRRRRRRRRIRPFPYHHSMALILPVIIPYDNYYDEY
ncbi:MAG: hypothetical protein LKJ66_14200 [Clostridium luticellarii]|jgi:hypothetical protein|uniref:Uncharacterized protein n=1 Tax=Clostridium luticellarii TaxID=1691940 RepID=A0A2T0BSQ7_9CLOT|nr:hypothetical protein [Clostridium luticellarii]MCI1946438.1 hypothetical protein [Clostridium luticellarii]MCI1996880.1 hypothetical protein [Clostridium luticellarii]MCI2041205.1 hypothetical protein [Clostridium luticellarii]PRR86899.1 hypothetical protein CLLU_00650 [Clostridium luticellarii]